MKSITFSAVQGIVFGSLVATISLVPAALANFKPLIVPTASAPAPIAAPQIAAATDTAAITQSVFNQVNQYRRSRGLPPLKLDTTISQQSLAHSRTMASTQRLSHDGFQQRATAIGRSIPFLGVAENVAYNMGHQDPATVAVQGWIKSAGHRQNMEGNYNFTGIGVAKTASGKYYLTQIFVRRR